MLILLFALFVSTLPDRPTDGQWEAMQKVAEIRKESHLDALDCIRGNMCPTPIRICTPSTVGYGSGSC